MTSVFIYVNCIVFKDVYKWWFSFHMWTVYKDGMTSVFICELYTRMEWLQFSYVNCIQGWKIPVFICECIQGWNDSVFICELYTRMEWLQFSYVNCMEWFQFSRMEWIHSFHMWTVYKDGIISVFIWTLCKDGMCFHMWTVYKDGMISVFICEVHTRMEWL